MPTPVAEAGGAKSDERESRPVPRKLLVLETDYTLEGLRQRGNLQSVICRDLGGFFEHVWSVHPFATLVTSDGWAPRNGKPDRYEVAPRHTIIEGRVGRFNWPSFLFPLNFLIGQWILFRHLAALIESEKIGIIRSASPLYVGLFGWLLKLRTGALLAIRVGANHDKFFASTGRPIEPRLMRSRRVEKWLERFIFSRADLVAGANQDNLDFALANGARPDRSTIFRYGNLVDRIHFVPPAERTIDPGVLSALGIERGRFLLYVGRLEPIKQADHVVRVLAHASKRGHDVTAVLAGEGSQRNAITELARELGVTERLRLPGNIDQERLAQLYPSAAMVLSPHTGRALSEAALAAAPVVAYDVDWQGEIIEDRITGRIVAHDDLPAFASAAEAMLADPVSARAMGEALRERALAMLDVEALDEHERQTYRRLLAGRAAIPAPSGA